MKKIIFTILLLIFVATNICVCAKNDNSGGVFISKIVYYGDYTVKEEREYELKQEQVKLPLEVKKLPVIEYTTSPDLIIVKAEIVNKTDGICKNVVAHAELRFKVGRIISDNNGNVDIEKSKRNSRWEKNFFEKDIIVKSIFPKSRKMIEITSFNVLAAINSYTKNNEKPWECEAKLIIKNNPTSGNAFIKTLAIGIAE